MILNEKKLDPSRSTANPAWMYEEGKENQTESRLKNLFPQMNAPPDFITTAIQL